MLVYVFLHIQAALTRVDSINCWVVTFRRGYILETTWSFGGMKKNISFFIGLFVLGGLYAIYLHADVSESSRYVTSEVCKDCHQSNYDSWKKNTLHPYMFRPVKSPEDLLGDFESNDPALTFKKEDVEYVVGNKWEQVYVRMIDGEYYPLPAKWYIMQNRWVPYKVNDWHEVPMSKKCNGCHTTGFDPATYQFSEFGIGCEACHGAGSKHVQNKKRIVAEPCKWCHAGEAQELSNKKDIIRSVSPTVCGQCHNRGQNAPKDGLHGAEFNFPVNFTPGGDIGQAYVPLTPEMDKKSEFWWGNGIAKNRHQEFGDWSKSKHANAVKKLKEKYEKGTHRGELTDECLYCHSTDFRHHDKEKPEKPTLDTAKFGVTCVACHEPHGRDKEFPHVGDGITQCGGCHVDSMSHSVAKSGKRHYPCPTSMVTCADCHMPRIVKTGGFFSIRSHRFKIVTPEEAQKNNMPSSCQNGGCHDNKTEEWAIDAYKSHYPKKPETEQVNNAAG